MTDDLIPENTLDETGYRTYSGEKQTINTEGGWLDREIFPCVTPARILLGVILLFGLALYLFNIDQGGAGNLYYSAAVKSMLQSGRDFFFLSAEPGGSVSVDKPPLGLWVQAGFASILGVTGYGMVLPGALAGILSILLLYWLVKCQFGSFAGLTAAIALAVTPVAVAVGRSNVLDGLLTFCLLLGAWAFIKAAENGEGRFLWLGALLTGLAFNIKMLQAYLALLGFFGVYFLGSEKSWRRKTADLIIAFLIILAVSLSWALVVDLTPAESRPYVGGSTGNSVLDLITGYNGIMRFFGPEDGTAGPPPSFEIGYRGWGRFLTPPLAKEISWLLPLALLGIGLALFSAPLKPPLRSNEQRGGLLWGGWLLTGLVFFSLAGFFHAYYLVMLAPPLAAGVGMGVSMLWRDREQRRRNLLLLVGFAAVTLVFQVALAGSYGIREAWIYAPLVLFLLGVLFLALFRSRRGASLLEVGAWGFLLAAVLVIPFGWSVLTMLEKNPHGGLPAAYQGAADLRRLPRQDQPGPVERRLIEYVSTRVREGAYLLAVPSAQQGALIVLETGKPVLYMGGFNGTDPVIDADGLAEMVERGDLRFVLYSRAGRWRDAQIGTWLDSACQVVPEFSPPDGPERRSPPSEGNPGLVYPPVLYDCWE